MRCAALRASSWMNEDGEEMEERLEDCESKESSTNVSM